jgi:hypothetical protein
MRAMAARSSERDAEDLLAALYAATPGEFVAVRNRVASELKESGRIEDAARVKALKRPPASVWAVNQLARRESDAIAELLALGDRVHAHERRVLRGGDAGDYLDEARQVRQRAAQLARRAEAILAAAGLSSNAAVARRMVQTLQAAALGDEEARAALAAGTLSADLAPTASFGAATPDLASTLAASLASAKSKPGRKHAAADHEPVPASGTRSANQRAAVRAHHTTADRQHAAAERENAAARHRKSGERGPAATRDRQHAAAAARGSVASSERNQRSTGRGRHQEQTSAGERAAQRKQAVAARRQATAERKRDAAAARAQAAAERKQAALDAREERAAQRRAQAATRKRIAAAARALATAERAVASHRAAVDRARDAVEAAESRLRAAKDELAAAELAAAAARRALEDASDD